MTRYRPDIPYLALPDRDILVDQNDASTGAPFFDEVKPASFPKHILRYRNNRWDRRVGLEGLDTPAWINHFGRFVPLPDNLPEPLAMRYHGHQFQFYNPDLGDGRGFLFAQLRDDKDRLLDLGTKGSGQTPWSRAGDGRLTLKGAVREILATEMLEALGVNTSKTFSIIETGEELLRTDEPSPTRSAVMVRLNHSHIRFGTFQRLAAHGEKASMQRLVDYCIEHFYPEHADKDAEGRALGLLDAVVKASAKLAASWMAAGFVHGVLNTDNMNITAESFDYGPWRFSEFFDAGFTAAYFDQQGLYAYGRQAEAVAWNLMQLANALSRIAPADKLGESLEPYASSYTSAMVSSYFARFGLRAEQPNDQANINFISELMAWMTNTKAPMEQVFFDWFGGALSSIRAKSSPIAEKYQSAEWKKLEQHIIAQPPARPERLGHAYFANEKPCTMLIDEVEHIWSRIDRHDDWSVLADKIDAIGEMREALG